MAFSQSMGLLLPKTFMPAGAKAMRSAIGAVA